MNSSSIPIGLCSGSFFRCSAAIIVFTFCFLIPRASPAQTTAPFAYQGRLTEAGNPSTGTFEMEFKLFATPDVGTGTHQGPAELKISMSLSAEFWRMRGRS